MVYNPEGKESEWNEAIFKGKRLNDIQERINFLKTSPMGISNNKFHYELYLEEIKALYEEGRSKYSVKEKAELDELRDKCIKALRYMPPHIKSKHYSIDTTNNTFIFNQKNYEMFMEILYKFEMRVRDLHDEHGLTTKNKEDDDMF